MSSQKQLSVVFGVANAQKQGVMGVRLALATSTTMFQEGENNGHRSYFEGGRSRYADHRHLPDNEQSRKR